MSRRFEHPRQRCTGNLRAAPFAITPSLVARMLELTPARSVIPAPPEPEITRFDPSHGAAANENGAPKISAIRAAELEAEVRMRTGVGAAIAREIARLRAERGGGQASFETPPAAAPQDERSAEPAPAAVPQPFVPEPVLGSRAPESRNGTGAQPVAPAFVDEAQHCHSLASADEHTDAAGAQPPPPEPKASKPRLGSRERAAAAQPFTSRSRHPVEKSGREVDGARGDVSRSTPVLEASPPFSLAASIAAETAIAADRRRVARKFGGGVGNPLPASTGGGPDTWPDTAFDAHERELRRIDTRPAIKTSDPAERRAARRAAEEAKARRLGMIVAAAEKLRRRRESEVDL